ncbi:MAG: MFS transporter [Deltaproteobacteria bacterium]|nr:MFS transporter [Deltaproteobacteria bacterium]
MTALNVMDRQLLSVLIDPIKAEFGVSDGAMGLLTGTAFAVLHGTAGIPIGLAADRGVRRTIVSTGLAIWSLLTLLTGFARSYAEIFAIRVGVGIGEAAGGAPSQSLLADVFPPERRATALSILAIGGPLGSVLVFALGGWLADAYGWRVAFMVFGAPGLLLAALIRFSVPEPARGIHDTHTIPFLVGLRFVFTVSSIRSVLFASGLHATAVYAVLGWSVPYLTRVHGISTTEAGARLAVASGLLSALGTLVGGALADRLGQRDRRWLVWQPAIALLLAFPFAVGFLFAHSASAAMWLLAPVSVLTGSCLGPFYSVVQTVVPPRMRALSAALVITSNTILGLGIGPPLVGWLNDVGAARFGAESIRYSLLAAMSMVLVSAGFLGWAGRSLEADLAAPRLDARDAMG